MTQPRKADVPATFTVEHDCPRRCQTEFDLDGIHVRFTLGMMLAAAEKAHDEAHATEPPQRAFRASDNAIIVRSSQLAAAS